LNTTAINRKIENPYWANKERQHIIAEFFYPDTNKRVTASIMNDGTNRDYEEVMRLFSVEQIDANTNRRTEERNNQIKQNLERQKVDKQRVQQEQLFAAKLDAFEIEAVKNSKNRELKSKIRKSKTFMEVTAYTVMLLMQEEANAE
jgi:type IV secretory pathway VirB10-like protein